MSRWWLLLTLIAVCGLGWAGLQRAGTLFILRVRAGQARLVHGRVPPRLLAELKDVLARARCRDVEVRGVRSGGACELRYRGDVGPAVQQQLRNVVAVSGAWRRR